MEKTVLQAAVESVRQSVEGQINISEVQDGPTCCSPSYNDSRFGKLKEWLNRPLKVELSDGRTVLGSFLCTDNGPNIILGGTREFWLNPDTGQMCDGAESRLIGLAMVPCQHIKKLWLLESNATHEGS